MGKVRDAYVLMGLGALVILLGIPSPWPAAVWVGAAIGVAGFIQWQVAARRGTSKR